MLKCEAVEPDGKSCSRCGQYKSLSDYTAAPRGRYGLRSECKPCMAKRHRDGDYGRKSRLKVRYGMTMNQWQEKLKQQGDGCALCGIPLELGRLGHAVDHCHQSGRVRDILCHQCNVGLGNFRDDAALLRRAADYIESHRAST